MKSNQWWFFQVFYIHIGFSIKFLLTYVSRIVYQILKISRIREPVPYCTPPVSRIWASKL